MNTSNVPARVASFKIWALKNGQQGGIATRQCEPQIAESVILSKSGMFGPQICLWCATCLKAHGLLHASAPVNLDLRKVTWSLVKELVVSHQPGHIIDNDLF